MVVSFILFFILKVIKKIKNVFGKNILDLKLKIKKIKFSFCFKDKT